MLSFARCRRLSKSFVESALQNTTISKLNLAARICEEKHHAKRSTRVDCRSEFVCTQATRSVGVFPLDRASVGRVGVDVAAEFSSQIRDRSEDAAGNDLALDFGEPKFDLVEPGGIGRSEVKPHPRLTCEEIADLLGFGRQGC